MSESRKLSGQEAQDPNETLESMADPISSSSSPTSSSLPPPSLPVKKDLAGVEELMAEKPSASGISLNDGTVPATAQVASSLEKKIRRAERFGVPVQLSEEEKRNSRAERFGTGVPPTRKDLGISEEQKRKARAERFGLAGNSTDENAKKKARLERFSQNPDPNTLEGEKRKARTIRFSGASNSSSETNGKKVTMSEKEGGNG